MAFFDGLGGIVLFIGVGEATYNTLIACMAVSFLFALLAGGFSWLAPHARWVMSLALLNPITLFALFGYSPSMWLLPVALWIIALTCGGAYWGSRLELGRSATS